VVNGKEKKKKKKENDESVLLKASVPKTEVSTPCEEGLNVQKKLRKFVISSLFLLQ